MKVSVVIPLHDRIQLIGYTLNSLDPSLHPGVELEIIVVDDYSFDAGDDFVAAYYPDVRLVSQKKRQGAPAARNRGVELSTSEFILLLDSDDLVEPGFFPPRIDALSWHPEADGAYGPIDHFSGIEGFDESVVIPRHTPYPIEDTASRSHILRTLSGWYIPSHAVLWRKSALKRVGGQNEDLPINQDVDLTLRILATGEGIVGVDAPRALLREHSENTQGKVNAYKAEQMLKLRREFISLLKEKDLWDGEMSRALGEFCFNQWRSLRRLVPKVAEDFYALSRELHPSYVPPVKFAAFSKLVGVKRFMVLRDALPL